MASNLANKVSEVIFIGLPGPTHNYGGLSADNVASSKNQGSESRPLDAAMQALGLARLLLSLGQKVAILPPQLRPSLPALKKYISGGETELIANAARQNPQLLEAVSSSSAMWVANAATVTAPQDATDDKLHLTVANLYTNLHRRIEAHDTYLVLKQIFAKVPRSVVDLPLNPDDGFRDEGAANHMRMAPRHESRGLNVFVYGTDDNPRDPKTARQTLGTSQEIIKRHQLQGDAAICIKQNPLAIESGVFHNDVIAVSNENMLLVHEDAYAMGPADINYIAESYAERTGEALYIRIITRKELSITEAVNTYFFNSQLISLPQGGMALIGPSDVRELYDGKAWKLMEQLLKEQNPINEVHSVDLHQSMRNGGGPACLRLRVWMDDAQMEAMRAHNNVMASEDSLDKLERAVLATYPKTLHASQIDHALYLRCREALKELGSCLKLDLLP